MARTRTVKDPVQKGRITIGEARSAAREAKSYRSAISGRYVTEKHGKSSPGTTVKESKSGKRKPKAK